MKKMFAVTAVLWLQLAFVFAFLDVQTSNTLKSYFETGDTPTEAEFAELIDTMFDPSTGNTIVHDTVSAMLADTNASSIPIRTNGYNSSGDGGANTYKYSAGSSATIDGINVLPGIAGVMSLDDTGTYDGGNPGTGRYLAVNPTKYDPILAGADNTGFTEATKFCRATFGVLPTFSNSTWTTGTYSVKDLSVPNRIVTMDFQNSTLVAEAGSTFVFELENTPNANRPGPPVVRDVTIDGVDRDLLGYTGLELVDRHDNAIFENLTIKQCGIGVNVFAPLNHHYHNCTIHRNVHGVKMTVSPTAGGGLVNIYDGTEFYLNTGCAIILDGTASPFPVAGNYFNNCIFQNNGHCAIAAFDATRIVDRGTHWEDNAQTSLDDEITVDGNVIKKRPVHLSNSEFFTDARSMQVYMEIGSKFTFLSDVNQGYNGGTITCETDGSDCRMYLEGKRFRASNTYQALIHEIPLDNDVNLKCAFVQPYRPTTDGWGITNLELDADTMMSKQSSNGLDGESLNQVDTTLINGVRHELDFGASVGDVSNNVFIFNTDDVEPVGPDDEILWQFPIRTSGTETGLFAFHMANGTLLESPIWVTPEWRMLTLQVNPAHDPGGNTELRIYPLDTQGLTLYVGGAMIQKIADGEDRTHIQRIVSEQIWVATGIE